MGKRVRIHRCAKDKDNPYKAVSRAPFDGSGLSFEARGVLAYALMKPDDWELNVPDLMREGGIGRDKAYKIIEELIAAGYGGRVEGRDKAGKFGGNEIHIYESPELAPNEQITPVPHPEKPDTVNPNTDNPHTEKPDTVSPDTENQEQTNKGKELNSEVTKKGGEGASPPPASSLPKAKDAKPPRISSPYLDPRHFVNGFVPPGTGTSAVEVYYERFSIRDEDERLTKPHEDDLILACKDLDRLREVITAYHRAGFKGKRNIGLILDWYRDPSRFRKEHYGHNGNGTTHYEPPPSASFSQREWNEYQDPRAEEIPY